MRAETSGARALVITQWPLEALGGIESMTRSLVAAARRSGIDVQIHHLYPAKLLEHPLVPGVARMPIRRLISLSTSGRLARRVQAPDVIIATHVDCMPAALLAKGRRGGRIILYAHGWEVAKRRHLPALRHLAGRADMILANSLLTADFVHECWMIPYSRLRVCPPGHSLQGAGAARSSPRQPLQLLTVGRINRNEQHKGHDVALQALAKLTQAQLAIRYSVVGQGDGLAGLRRLAAELRIVGYVDFVGAVSNDSLQGFYEKADVFVMPTRRQGASYEGFGIVFSEAMSHGLPCIMGRYSGAASHLSDGAMVIDGEDAEAVTDAIRELATNPSLYAQLSQKAVTTAAMMTWDRVSSDHLRAWLQRP